MDNVELPLPVENNIQEYFEKIINDKKYAYAVFIHKVLSQIEKIKE